MSEGLQAIFTSCALVKQRLSDIDLTVPQQMLIKLWLDTAMCHSGKQHVKVEHVSSVDDKLLCLGGYLSSVDDSARVWSHAVKTAHKATAGLQVPGGL